MPRLVTVPSYDPAVLAATHVAAIHKPHLTFLGWLLGLNRYRCRKCRTRTDKNGCWKRRSARSTVVQSKYARPHQEAISDDYLFRPSEQLDVLPAETQGLRVPVQREPHPAERTAVPV